MARIPYADLDNPSTESLVDRIVSERGSVLHLYRMLLHSPPIAAGWLTFLTSVRKESSLPGSYRELVIMRVAHVNGASYEADQHRPIALAEGVSEAKLDALPDWSSSVEFDPAERAILSYTDAITREASVCDRVFRDVRAVVDNRVLVELTATISAYNMVSRFLNALNIHSHDL